MSLYKWSPTSSISSFFDDEFDFPSIVSRNSLSGINLYENENEVVAEMAMPGIHEEKIDISVDGRLVSISSSHEEKEENKSKNKYMMKTMSSSFNYQFRLPEGVSTKDPKANLRDGVLTVKFAKNVPDTPKKIKVTKN